MRLLAVSAICAAAIFGFACSDDEDNPNDATGASNGTGASDREKFIDDAEARIEDLRRELEEIREDIASGDASDELEDQAENLNGRIDDAEAELDKIRAANEDEWEDLKAEFDNALQEADALIEDIGAELGLN